MLLGSNLVLNHSLSPNSLTIQPFCLNSCNRRAKHDHLEEISVPDVSPGDWISGDVEFSMCAGDFVEVSVCLSFEIAGQVYKPQKAEWDIVLTCFFLDTAKNILNYVHTIANIIPEGGLWANVGPLLYHFADSQTEMSIELSWEELKPGEYHQLIMKLFFSNPAVFQNCRREVDR